MSLSSWDLAAHRPAVRRFMGGRLRNAAQADEATQETLVRAFVRRETLADPSRLGPWLFGIAKRVLAEERRRIRKAQERHLSEAVLERVPSPADPHAELVAKETMARVADGVASLQAEKRSALLLRVDDELGYAEIAARLGWSIPKVKNEIHRARLLLKALLVAAACACLLLALPSRSHVSTARDGAESGQCYESGMGPVAELESERAACLMASPAPIADVEPLCQ